MPFILNLQQDQFISQEAFRNFYPDGYLDEISNGVIDEQVVPKIYLSRNNIILNGTLQLESDEGYERFDVFSMPGFALIIMSFTKEVVFLIQEYNSRIERQFSHTESYFYPFLTISRANLSSYEKLRDGDFLAVKPKKSISLAINAARRGVGRGIIPGLIMKGVISSVDRNEDDLDMRRGVKFRLHFTNDLQSDYVDIVSHPSATDQVEKFLKSNWSNIEPAKIELNQKKEGCYIATCCYGSYEHRSVLRLRKFRDEILLKKALGKVFVNFYYKYSPKIAERLAKRPVVNLMVKIVFLEPLIFIVRLTSN